MPIQVILWAVSGIEHGKTSYSAQIAHRRLYQVLIMANVNASDPLATLWCWLNLVPFEYAVRCCCFTPLIARRNYTWQRLSAWWRVPSCWLVSSDVRDKLNAWFLELRMQCSVSAKFSNLTFRVTLTKKWYLILLYLGTQRWFLHLEPYEKCIFFCSKFEGDFFSIRRKMWKNLLYKRLCLNWQKVFK